MIRVENLVKKFGDFAAVDNISFEVPKGEIFAFLGPNGAGKTTTIKVLTTLLKATSGTVELDGMNPATHENEVRQAFWNRVPGSQPRPGFDGLGEHGFARSALSRAGKGAAGARGNAAEAV